MEKKYQKSKKNQTSNPSENIINLTTTDKKNWNTHFQKLKSAKSNPHSAQKDLGHVENNAPTSNFVPIETQQINFAPDYLQK